MLSGSNAADRGGDRNSSSSGGGGGSSASKKGNPDESIVRKLMLDSWNQSIFMNIKNRLQDSAMKLVHAERNGDAFDSQLVIGVRESYVNLCSNPDDKLSIYRENFEAAYLQASSAFYRLKASEQLQAHGVQAFMRYADTKLREVFQIFSIFLMTFYRKSPRLIFNRRRRVRSATWNPAAVRHWPAAVWPY